MVRCNASCAKMFTRCVPDVAHLSREEAQTHPVRLGERVDSANGYAVWLAYSCESRQTLAYDNHISGYPRRQACGSNRQHFVSVVSREPTGKGTKINHDGHYFSIDIMLIPGPRAQPILLDAVARSHRGSQSPITTQWPALIHQFRRHTWGQLQDFYDVNNGKQVK